MGAVVRAVGAQQHAYELRESNKRWRVPRAMQDDVEVWRQQNVRTWSCRFCSYFLIEKTHRQIIYYLFHTCRLTIIISRMTTVTLYFSTIRRLSVVTFYTENDQLKLFLAKYYKIYRECWLRTIKNILIFIRWRHKFFNNNSQETVLSIDRWKLEMWVMQSVFLIIQKRAYFATRKSVPCHVTPIDSSDFTCTFVS